MAQPPSAPRGAADEQPSDETDHELDDEIVDELPADLDITAITGPYVFPDTRRRRLAAVLYLVLAAVCLLAAALAGGSPQVNGGITVAGIVLAIVAVHSWVTGWSTELDESDALARAAVAFGFPVGHASAQLSWRGWTSRPTWKILAFSAEDQPTLRGLATVDAVDGRVLEHYTEPNEEDWSTLVA